MKEYSSTTPNYTEEWVFDQENTGIIDLELFRTSCSVDVGAAKALRSLTWTLNPWKPNDTDCFLHRGKLTIYEDGNFNFWADVSSTDSNDTWKNVVFEFSSKEDSRLYAKGTFTYHMDGDQCRTDRPCRWVINNRPLDPRIAEIFNQAWILRIYANC